MPGYWAPPPANRKATSRGFDGASAEVRPLPMPVARASTAWCAVWHTRARRWENARLPTRRVYDRSASESFGWASR